MRELLKGLAGSGRSVFVSSHLLSEMALMADHLVVVGRGRLIANGPIDDFIKNAGTNAVIVRTPQATQLAELVAGQKPGRCNDEAITLFDSSGLGLQDVAAAAAIYHRALERGAGDRLPLN